MSVRDKTAAEEGPDADGDESEEEQQQEEEEEEDIDVDPYGLLEDNVEVGRRKTLRSSSRNKKGSEHDIPGQGNDTDKDGKSASDELARSAKTNADVTPVDKGLGNSKESKSPLDEACANAMLG